MERKNQELSVKERKGRIRGSYGKREGQGGSVVEGGRREKRARSAQEKIMAEGRTTEFLNLYRRRNVYRLRNVFTKLETRHSVVCRHLVGFDD